MPKQPSKVVQIADSPSTRRGSVARRLNKSEAQALTAQIRATGGLLWQLVSVAYDRKAWQALGYDSWKAYAQDELQMSESRSYQLVDTGRVMRAISDVVGNTEVFETIQPVTARETQRVKPHLSTFKKQIQAALKQGLSPEEAVHQAMRAMPDSEPKAPRRSRDESSGKEVLEGDVVEEEPAGTLLLDQVDLSGLQPRQAEGGPAAPPVAAPLFSGHQTCPTCSGTGWV